jgi:hypothetical protein
VFNSGTQGTDKFGGLAYVLDDLLFIITNEDGERITQFLLYLKAKGAHHPLMLDKLRAHLARGPKPWPIPSLLGEHNILSIVH